MRAAIMKDLLDRLPGKQRASSVSEALLLSDVSLSDSGTGVLKTERAAAEVRIEPDDFLCVRAPVAFSGGTKSALQATGRLPGNTRLSLRDARWCFAGETRLNGLSHLPESVSEIRNGLERVGSIDGLARMPDDRDEDASGSERLVHEAIDQAAWTREQAVETGAGRWELQSRVAGRSSPVELSTTRGTACLQRCVVEHVPDADCGLALCHQALQFNEQLRFTRLAIDADRLVVQSQLRADLIVPEWLDFTSRAVAAASLAVTATLDVLARDETVASSFLQMFPPDRVGSGTTNRP